MTRRAKTKEQRSKSDKSSVQRKGETLDQRKLVILACEGEKTEVNYFRSVFEELKQKKQLASGSCVIAKHSHTNPTGVLSDLLNHKTEFGGTYKDFQHRWIVIDRDPERTNGGGHTVEDFQSAINQSSKHKVNVAWSNPCFELWILLHYDLRESSIDRDDFSSKLRDRLGREYSKNDTEIFNTIRSRLDVALRNSRTLYDRSKGKQPHENNPCTTIFQLIESVQLHIAAET
jgi:hypothetical protein